MQIQHHPFDHLDAFVPTGDDGQRPAVMFVHGGGWQGGKRDQFHDHAQRLAERGYVTASVTYRLSDVAQWPAQLDDVRQRLREFASYADEWQFDLNRIGLVGSSAGGHLVACLATRHAEVADLPVPACVVDVHGVHDCPRRPAAGSLTKLLGPIDEHRDRWEDASPIRFVDGATVPMLFTHDPDDQTVPYEQTTRMIAALVEAARPVEFIPTPGSGHGFVYNLNNEWAARIWPDIVNYLDRKLKPTNA